MYLHGKDIPPDDQKALKLTSLSAKQGFAPAQVSLGSHYSIGFFVPQSHQTALKWYSLAEKQGWALGQFGLGLAYRRGEGVAQDNVYARMWLNIVSLQGYEEAEFWRDNTAQKMPPSQIEKAQDRAQECIKKNYQDC